MINKIIGSYGCELVFIDFMNHRLYGYGLVDYVYYDFIATERILLLWAEFLRLRDYGGVMHGITIQHIARSIADLSKWVIRSKINPTN
jgi:hypothetical protein